MFSSVSWWRITKKDDAQFSVSEDHTQKMLNLGELMKNHKDVLWSELMKNHKDVHLSELVEKSNPPPPKKKPRRCSVQ